MVYSNNLEVSQVNWTLNNEDPLKARNLECHFPWQNPGDALEFNWQWEGRLERERPGLERREHPGSAPEKAGISTLGC